MNNKKIFDDFPNQDCNHCTHYWNNKCDADMLLQGSKFPCKSFSPTRGITIPQEIKTLKNEIFWLKVFVCILISAVSILGISVYFG